MTEVEPTAPLDESLDEWDVVFRALGRRRLFRLALACLALLYAGAIYAPLVANDRPYLLEGIDRAGYEKARRGLVPISQSLRDLAQGGAAAHLALRTPGSEQSFAQALAAEARALDDRLATLRASLPSARSGELERLAQLGHAVAALALAGDVAQAAEQAELLDARARELRDALQPSVDGGGGVELVARRSYPLLESISAVEVFFMVLWAFVLAWPLWNPLVNRLLLRSRRARIRRARRRKLVVAVASALLCAVLWKLSVDGQTSFHTAPYKQALTRGELEATRVVFPPLALGFAETHLQEALRPPTWTAAAEISAEGFYVRGPRAPRADAAAAFRPGPQPVEVRFGEPERNAPGRHLLGTDGLGRDLFVRALYGARVSLSVGIVSTVLLVVIGTVVGALAGSFGGRVDLLLSRLIEVVICFPVFFLILVIVAFVGPSILSIMVVIGLLRWTGVARLVRAEFLRLQSQDFVVAARALGLSRARTIFRHVLPNALGPLLVAATFAVAAGILIESGLSFLGFGIQAPIPSWGSLVNESRNPSHWWIHVFPGALIFVTVLCYNLVGDAIRDALDPRTRA